MQDLHGARLVLRALRPRRARPRLARLWADAAYDRPTLQEWVRETLGLEVTIVRKLAAQRGFVPLPTRWVVERTFGWLGRYRRLSKDYEETPPSSAAWIQLAMIHLMVRRLA